MIITTDTAFVIVMAVFGSLGLVTAISVCVVALHRASRRRRQSRSFSKGFQRELDRDRERNQRLCV